MIKEISFQTNNASAWYVKEWKDGSGKFTPYEYTVYPEIKVVNTENGSLEITRRPFSQYTWASTYAYIADTVNIVDNKLYYDFTAQCQWNFSLALGSNKDTNADNEILNMTSYIMKQETGKVISYVTDGDPGTYKGCLDLNTVIADAVANGNLKSGLVNDDEIFIGRVIIWTVGAAEDSDTIVVNDLYMGREGTAPTDPDVTDPTDPDVTDPTDPDVTDPTDPDVTDPADPDATDPVGTGDPTTGDADGSDRYFQDALQPEHR